MCADVYDVDDGDCNDGAGCSEDGDEEDWDGWDCEGWGGIPVPHNMICPSLQAMTRDLEEGLGSHDKQVTYTPALLATSSSNFVSSFFPSSLSEPTFEVTHTMDTLVSCVREDDEGDEGEEARDGEVVRAEEEEEEELEIWVVEVVGEKATASNCSRGCHARVLM